MSGATKKAFRASANDESAATKRPLWTCPKCGQKFVTRNMWHSCGSWTVEGFLGGKGPRARELFEAFVSFAGRCGPFDLAPTKTGVSFMVWVRFAGVQRLSDRGITCGFWLKRQIHSPRFSKVEFIPRDNWIYHFRVTSPDELDAEVLGWLKEAYDVGLQKHVERKANR